MNTEIIKVSRSVKYLNPWEIEEKLKCNKESEKKKERSFLFFCLLYLRKKNEEIKVGTRSLHTLDAPTWLRAMPTKPTPEPT